MEFARGILLLTCLFSAVSVSQKTSITATQESQSKVAISRASQLSVPPNEAFATVLERYHTSLNSEQTQAVKVVRPSAEGARAEYVGPAEARAKKLAGEKLYRAEAVDASLTSLRGDILAKIPADDAPLRHYVETRFPKTPATKEGFISEGDLQVVNDTANGMVMELRRADGFTVDMKVTSNVERARFVYGEEYPPKEGDGASDETEVFTDYTIPQMWRGPYIYRVEKKGFWQVIDKLNTISQKGDTLECHLVPSSEPKGGECVLK